MSHTVSRNHVESYTKLCRVQLPCVYNIASCKLETRCVVVCFITKASRVHLRGSKAVASEHKEKEKQKEAKK